MARKSRIAAQDKAWELLRFMDPHLPDPTGRRDQLARRVDQMFQGPAPLHVVQLAVEAVEIAYLLGRNDQPPG